MKVYLGEVTIEIIKKINTGNDLVTMNCTFTKGFSNGKGSREIKNFYFYLHIGKGLVFKGGMNWTPYQLKDYMEFLKGEYLELQAIRYFNREVKITGEEFLGFLVSKRRTEIINDIIK
jgi:hypothetical protein